MWGGVIKGVYGLIVCTVAFPGYYYNIYVTTVNEVNIHVYVHYVPCTLTCCKFTCLLFVELSILNFTLKILSLNEIS